MGKDVPPLGVAPAEANPKLGEAAGDLLFGFDCMKHMIDKVGGFAVVSTCMPEDPLAEDDFNVKAAEENNEDESSIFELIDCEENSEHCDFGIKIPSGLNSEACLSLLHDCDKDSGSGEDLSNDNFFYRSRKYS